MLSIFEEEIGSRGLEVGGWKLGIGNWKLGVGDGGFIIVNNFLIFISENS